MNVPACSFSPLELPATAWHDIAAQAWDRRPLLLRQPFANGYPTVDDVFGALLAESERIRKGGPQSNFRLYLEQEGAHLARHDRFYAAAVASPFAFLPVPIDRTLARYVARLARLLEGRRFALVLNECHRHFPMWRKGQSFLEGLYRQMGLTTGGAEMVAFIGNYTRTPFGIHKDREHVFTFVLEGSKHMLLWPLETFTNAGHPEVPIDAGARQLQVFVPDRREHSRAMKAATRLRGYPGDLIYWPASYWHLALGAEGVTVTVTAGVAASLPPFLRVVPPHLLSQQPEWRPEEVAGRQQRWGGRRPSPRLAAILRGLPAGASGATARQAVIDAWLRYLTAAGFDPLPNLPAAEAPRDFRWIRGHPSRPLAWARAGTDEIILSGNGQSMRCPADPRVMQLVARLNTGLPLEVKQLVRQYSGSLRLRGHEFHSSRGGVRLLLEIFLGWGAASPE